MVTEKNIYKISGVSIAKKPIILCKPSDVSSLSDIK